MEAKLPPALVSTMNVYGAVPPMAVKRTVPLGVTVVAIGVIVKVPREEPVMLTKNVAVTFAESVMVSVAVPPTLPAVKTVDSP